jgi:hypothetical protein
MLPKEATKCEGFRGASKALIYILALVLIIDAFIVALLRLVTLFRGILGDGFTVTAAITIGIVATYCMYLILHRLLEI